MKDVTVTVTFTLDPDEVKRLKSAAAKQAGNSATAIYYETANEIFRDLADDDGAWQAFLDALHAQGIGPAA